MNLEQHSGTCWRDEFRRVPDRCGSVEEKEGVAGLCFFITKSMLMRDVVAALLRYGEFASQFHLRPLAIPSLGSYTDPTWTDRGHMAHKRCDSNRIAAGMHQDIKNTTWQLNKH